MASDILKTLTAVNQLPEHYYIMELSAELRHRQQQTLQNQAPDFLSRVIWLDRLPEQKLQAVILANEVLDAMPVHRFFFAKNFQECYVTKHQDQFAWELGPLSSTALADETTLPAQMGESFKAMALSKNYDQALLGFATMNQLERL